MFRRSYGVYSLSLQDWSEGIGKTGSVGGVPLAE